VSFPQRAKRLAIPCCLLLISFYVVLEIAKKSFATTVSTASYDKWNVLRSSVDRVEIGDGPNVAVDRRCFRDDIESICNGLRHSQRRHKENEEEEPCE